MLTIGLLESCRERSARTEHSVSWHDSRGCVRGCTSGCRCVCDCGSVRTHDCTRRAARLCSRPMSGCACCACCE
eukprot:5404055-Pleurochrysis_carterae.AAC.2